MNPGDTFFFEGAVDNHLWMVLSDPAQNDKEVLIVHFATWKRWWDQACIINVGEHSFITRKTIVAYEEGRVPPFSLLLRLWQDDRLKFHDPCLQSCCARSGSPRKTAGSSETGWIVSSPRG